MGSFSSLGIGLSLLFGCILLGLVAELYYVLWWKKKFTKTEPQNHHTKHTTDLPHLFCCKTPNFPLIKKPPLTSNFNGHDQDQDQDPELGLGLAKTKDLHNKGYFGEESVESELMRAHNLCGPPRFLFTIKEETKEDLDSIGTPLASPPLKPQFLGSCNNHHGFKFNPLFESSKEAELTRFRSSPPPKFKFLRDAEEKLMRKLMEEAERKFGMKNEGSVQDCGVKASSQVLPLATSPTRESN